MFRSRGCDRQRRTSEQPSARSKQRGGKAPQAMHRPPNGRGTLTVVPNGQARRLGREHQVNGGDHVKRLRMARAQMQRESPCDAANVRA